MIKWLLEFLASWRPNLDKAFNHSGDDPDKTDTPPTEDMPESGFGF